MPRSLGYSVVTVNHQLMQDGVRSAALIDHNARQILVSSVVPITDQLRACVLAGARLESMKHLASIPLVPYQEGPAR